MSPVAFPTARRRQRTAASGIAPSFDVSIVICTRDRCGHLRACLDQLARARVPAGWRVELVVVDNGSSDATPAVIEGFQPPHLPVRYVHEPRKGKGHAYNAGLAAARGAVLLLTDDDTRVPGDWIEQMCRPILAGEAEAVQGGVTIAPHLERPWLKGVLRTWVAEVANPDFQPPGLVGANMAFGRKALAAAGSFDVRLGPGAAGFFDDMVFGAAIAAAGQTILFRPTVAVEHHFDADRLSLAAFLACARRMAASRALVQRDLDPHAPRPGWWELLRQLPGLAVRATTQAGHYLVAQHPDAGFLHRYYRLCLWRALRALPA